MTLGTTWSAAVVAAAATGAAGCHHAAPPQVFIDTAVVARAPLVITVSSTGTIEPAEEVLVKSKASGIIIKMPVTMGTDVKPGDLIAQIDPRDAQSKYSEAVAAVNAAKANVEVTRAQKARADQLFNERAMTAPDHETAVLGYANAQSNLATQQANLEDAQIALEDVTVRATQAGTVIDKEVAEGQVIASATTSVSGGTTLVTLANLQNIVDSALVTESDIGKVHIGEEASVTVDAYPDKVFHGMVDNVSPEAVVVQSVTMFPVIIRLDNTSRLLKPGMNSDVSILVEQRTNALVIPNDAIGSTTDLAQAGTALGVDPTLLRQALGAGGAAGGARGSSGRGGRGAKGAGRGAGAKNPNGTPASGAAGATSTTSTGTPGLTAAQESAFVRRARAADTGGAINPALGYDTSKVRTALVDSAAGALVGVADTTTMSGGTASSSPHPAVVLVIQNGKFVPKQVMLGIGNYDETEVLSGLQAGDRVALVAEIRVQAARDSSLSRLAGRVGLPGMGGGGGGRGGGSRKGGR
jgi:HlyD family secretion protein